MTKLTKTEQIELINQYKPLITSLSKKFQHSTGLDVEDLEQEAILRILVAVEGETLDSNIFEKTQTSYLQATIKNHFTDLSRQHKKSIKTSPLEEEMSQLATENDYDSIDHILDNSIIEKYTKKQHLELVDIIKILRMFKYTRREISLILGVTERQIQTLETDN